MCVAPEPVMKASIASLAPTDQPRPGPPESHVRRCQTGKCPLTEHMGSPWMTPDSDPSAMGVLPPLAAPA